MKARLATISTIIVLQSSRFISWWIQQLSWFIPTRWRRTAPARLEARQDGDSIRLSLVRPPSRLIEARLNGGHVEPSDFFSNRAFRGRRVDTWLYPTEDSILCRVVQVPASAAARFESLLHLELDRWSPYSLNEVYVSWSDLPPVERSARRNIALRLIPRTQVDSLRLELAAMHLIPSFLILGPENQHRVDLRSRTGRLITRGALPLFATVLLLLGFLVLDWWVARSDLEQWRERYREEVKSFSSQRNLEGRIMNAITTMELAANSVSRGKVLANLSAAIPEADWLTEVVFKNESLVVRGHSADLDRFIKALERLAVAGSITLQGEVTLDTNTNRQRFSVVLRPNGTLP